MARISMEMEPSSFGLEAIPELAIASSKPRSSRKPGISMKMLFVLSLFKMSGRNVIDKLVCPIFAIAFGPFLDTAQALFMTVFPLAFLVSTIVDSMTQPWR